MNILSSEERKMLETVRTFHELANLAIAALKRRKDDGREIVQICGPFTTGGCGDLEGNMERFKRAIEVAEKHGLVVFDQTAFQDAMVRICKWGEGCEYPTEILTVFYDAVLRSGHIRKGIFLPDWESSIGASWERGFLTELGLAVEDYPPEWITEIDRKELSPDEIFVIEEINCIRREIAANKVTIKALESENKDLEAAIPRLQRLCRHQNKIKRKTNYGVPYYVCADCEANSVQHI